jgi:hypothetical protein
MTRGNRRRFWDLCSFCIGCSLGMAGCSVLGWGDIDLASCSEADADRRSRCYVLDQRDGIASDACEHWQCRRDGRGCELRARDADDDGHPDAKVCRDVATSSLDCDDARADRYAGLAENCDGSTMTATG